MLYLCTVAFLVKIADAPEDNDVAGAVDDGVADPSLGQEYLAIDYREPFRRHSNGLRNPTFEKKPGTKSYLTRFFLCT